MIDAGLGGQGLDRCDADHGDLQRQCQPARCGYADPDAGEGTRPDADRDHGEFAIDEPGVTQCLADHFHQVLGMALAEVEHRAAPLATAICVEHARSTQPGGRVDGEEVHGDPVC